MHEIMGISFALTNHPAAIFNGRPKNAGRAMSAYMSRASTLVVFHCAHGSVRMPTTTTA